MGVKFDILQYSAQGFINNPTVQVPEEIQGLLGKVMGHDRLRMWYLTTVAELDDKTPLDMWLEDQSRVLALIDAGTIESSLTDSQNDRTIADPGRFVCKKF